MIDPSHLDLAQRKALCARLIALRATRPKELAFLRAGVEDEFREIELRVLNRSAKGLTDSPNTERLDSFVRRTVQDLRTELQPYLKYRQSQVFVDWIEEVENNAKEVDCLRCSPPPGVICDGSDADHVIVNSGGRCIQGVRQVFDDALRNTVRFYQRFSTLYGGSRLPEVQLSTCYYQDKPHPFPIQYYVSGATRYHDSNSELLSEVRFNVFPKNFDWDSYLASYYVFLHECVCHVFQGIHTTGLRDVTEPSDPFAEGWMDWISFTMLQDLFAARSGVPSTPFSEDLGQQRVAFNFHDTRLDFRRSDRSEYSANWATGKEAAQQLLSLFARLRERGMPSSRTLLLRFSFDFNLSAYPSKQRELFVWHVNRYFPARGSIVAPTLWSHLVGISRNYMKTFDINDLVTAVLNLPGRI